MKHIGIVGVSPSGASLCFNEIVAEAARFRNFPVDHPEITINNVSFADYYNAGPKEGSAGWEKVHEIVLESIGKLKYIGADFVIIPANTAHCEFENLKKKSPLPIIDIVDAAIEDCKIRNIRSAIVLGTRHVIASGLYEKRMADYGIEYFSPSETVLVLLQEAINVLIAGGTLSESTIQKLTAKIKSINCEAAILACTELPIVFDEMKLEMPVINTTKVLAKRAFDFATNRASINDKQD